MVQGSDSPKDILHVSARARQRLDEAEQFLLSGNGHQARDACRELLVEHAEYVGAMILLGRAYMALRDYEAALPCFSRAVMLSPYDPSLHFHLAQNYFDLGAGEMALHAAEVTLSLQLEDALAGDAHLFLGRVYEQRADYERAVEHLKKAQALNPELVDAALLLGRCLLELGEREACAKAYASIPDDQVSPMDRCRMLYDLASYADAGEAKDLLAKIDALSNESVKFEDDRQQAIFGAHLELARASVLEAQNKHEAAWEALTAGNTPMQKLHGGDAAQSKDALKRASGWNFAGPATIPFGNKPPMTLFLLGPSQSGKTLLERLISTMEGSWPCHESNIVHAATVRTCNSEGLMTLDQPGQFPGPLHEPFSKNYKNELKLRAPEAKLFTITHPDMIADLGSIAETVQNMRVIFMDRDVDDAALRIFGRVYAGDTGAFAYDVAAIYEYLENYRLLAAAWADCLPGLTMQISYEDMISDPKKVLKQVADFCDLPAAKGKHPRLDGDRGCAKPYLEHLNQAKTSS